MCFWGVGRDIWKGRLLDVPAVDCAILCCYGDWQAEDPACGHIIHAVGCVTGPRIGRFVL